MTDGDTRAPWRDCLQQHLSAPTQTAPGRSTTDRWSRPRNTATRNSPTLGQTTPWPRHNRPAPSLIGPDESTNQPVRRAREDMPLPLRLTASQSSRAPLPHRPLPRQTSSLVPVRLTRPHTPAANLDSRWETRHLEKVTHSSPRLGGIGRQPCQSPQLANSESPCSASRHSTADDHTGICQWERASALYAVPQHIGCMHRRSAPCHHKEGPDHGALQLLPRFLTPRQRPHNCQM